MKAETGGATITDLRHEVDQLIGDRREARILVSLMLDLTPASTSAMGDTQITPEVRRRVLAAASRYAGGEPMAYATGRAAFRDLILRVDSRVLIPRPETEIVVDEALRISIGSGTGGTAVDIGTGSGAIAISLANEGNFARIVATDVSEGALQVAEQNALTQCIEMRPEFRMGDAFAPLEGVRARVIVSNPPYIAYDEADALPRSVREHEPPLALFASGGGMAMYDVLLSGAPAYLEPGGWIVLEVDSRRAGMTARRATEVGAYRNIRLVQDLTGRQRVLVAQLAD